MDLRINFNVNLKPQAPYQHPLYSFLPSPGNSRLFYVLPRGKVTNLQFNFYLFEFLQRYILQLPADITITITGGIIHIQIERRTITAIIPITTKLSYHKANHLVTYM